MKRNLKEEDKPFKDMLPLTKVQWEKFKKNPIPNKKEEPKKIFDLPIASNLGSALTETMLSVSKHEGGIKQGEINLPNFKEEPCTCTDECLGYLTQACKGIEEINKQETLEEAANKANGYNLYSKETKSPIFNEGFIEGAKWQQEKMYSEEEVLDLLCARNIELNLYEGRDKVEQWFEQFKK